MGLTWGQLAVGRQQTGLQKFGGREHLIVLKTDTKVRDMEMEKEISILRE